MNARRFQRAWAHGRREAERLEPRLQEQYEAAIRAAGNRAVKAYKRAATVTLAAANPTMQEVLDARVLEESALARTAATRKRIAEAASVVAVESAEARRLISPLLETLVEQQAGVQAARLVAGAQEAVAATMLDALTEGWSVPRTADALREKFSEFSRSQSTMLARTDLISISNGASVATASSLGSGGPAFKTWLATFDNRTRPAHATASGQTVPFNQPFNVAGVAMMYPGDPSGPDDECINCRCTLIYEDEPATQLLHSDEGGIQAAADTEGILEGDMPWKVVERDGEFCVDRSDTGAQVKCHPTREKAEAHQKALYANTGEMHAAAVSNKAAEASQHHAGHPDRNAPVLRQDPARLLPPEHDGRREALDLGLYGARRAAPAVAAPPAEFRNTESLMSDLQNPGSVVAAVDLDGDVTDTIIACAYCAENGCAQEAAAQTASGACCQSSGTGSSDCCQETLIGENLGSVLIAAIPVAPPSEWFETPEADEPIPITITADGKMYGFAALWGTCHTGFPGRCRTAPMSASGYRYYHLGAVDTAEGKTIPVGNITLGTGHASLTASRQEVAAHYDNTGTVVADVVATDGKLGIWVAGALRPNVSEADIRTLRAAKLSGDWRGVNGSLEMIGLLAVNVPGFPVPRPTAALAASGEGEEVVALVAAGIVGEDDVEDVTEQEFTVRMSVLTSRSKGIDALVAQGLGETEQEARLRTTVARRGREPDAINDIEREIGLRVEFFGRKGYWPANPQSGARFDSEEWLFVQNESASLITDPDAQEMEQLLERLLDRGFLTA